MSCEDYKNKYQQQLLTCDGVEGVGITEEKGQEILVIYISNHTLKLTEFVKQYLKDCPVKFEKTGVFQPQ
jgi:hypothetical protein